MVADTKRERLVNNILFNLNTLTIAVLTGLVAASCKTAFDRVVNGNYPIVESGHVVVLMDKWCEQVYHSLSPEPIREAMKKLKVWA